MDKIQIIHMVNISYIQDCFEVDELTSIYMAEGLTAEDMGYDK